KCVSGMRRIVRGVTQRSSEATYESTRTIRAPRTRRAARRSKKFSVSIRPQEIHDPSTGFPQLTTRRPATTLGPSMRRRSLVAAIVVVITLAAHVRAASAQQDDDATLLRVFLRDGSSLVSYGEPARVGDRIVFSMPTEPTRNPPLHLVNL